MLQCLLIFSNFLSYVNTFEREQGCGIESRIFLLCQLNPCACVSVWLLWVIYGVSHTRMNKKRWLSYTSLSNLHMYMCTYVNGRKSFLKIIGWKSGAWWNPNVPFSCHASRHLKPVQPRLMSGKSCPALIECCCIPLMTSWKWNWLPEYRPLMLLG